MSDIIELIKNNENIDYRLKNKVIECVGLILKKYPIAYRNLYTNLETITIRYTNIEDKIRLREIGADSCYNCEANLLLLNEKYSNSEYYKNIIIHELLHVASFNENNMGFESLYAKRGLSFNEGMTEYLTREILNDHTRGFINYQNDVNNINLLSIIVSMDKLIHLYFTEGLLGLFTEYLNAVGKNNNLENLMIFIDEEFGIRTRRGQFENQYKDKYIELFIDDISKIEFKDDNEIINTIKQINNFIRLQYKTDKVPMTIKTQIEQSISTIFSKSSLAKSKNL